MSFWSEATESIDTFVQKTVFTAVFFIYIESMIDIYSLAKNPLVFQKQRTITSAYIDVSGKMGLAQTVLMVQDNFTENFGTLKMDNFCVNEKGGYWAITKAKFKFFQRPYWRDKVVTTSFPADSAPIRTYENTAVTTVEGEPIILAVQEACCLNLETHRPMKLSAVDFPAEGSPEPFMDNKFSKFPVEPEEYQEVYRQKVLPQHIDMSHHMNNIEYVKLGLNVFSAADLELCIPSMLELHFMGETREGQEVKIFRADKMGATYMKIEDDSGRQVFEMKVKMK
ncbi:Acyl-ACP thioesterase [Fibrobacter sp. UWH4]|nr:Acyl-ACP thioesterase [Fibrobacter sp. UWH4]